MSHLHFTDYKGFGEHQRKNVHYSQAVKIGDIIEASGQGGWDRTTGEVHSDTIKQIDQAFENVEHTLQQAGGKGWEQVYKVRSYHVPLDDEALDAMVRNLKKWCPDHQPLFTVLGVPRLGIESMRVEVEVKAHVGN